MGTTYTNDGDSFHAVGEAIRLVFGVSFGHSRNYLQVIQIRDKRYCFDSDLMKNYTIFIIGRTGVSKKLMYWYWRIYRS